MTIDESLKSALLSRAHLQGFEAIRVFNGISDGVAGLTVDRFGRYYQIQCFQPQSEDTLHAVKDFLCSDELIESQRADLIVVKNRVSPSGASLQNPEMDILWDRHSLGDSAQTQVREGQAQIEVDLLDTINPGLFLDMREYRMKHYQWLLDMRSEADELKVLNLFSYTCSFGLHSAMAGADYTCNVDISAKILDRGRRNYQLSGLDDQEHGFVREDARKFLEFCAKKGKKFQSIVLDPPTFARYKKKTWSVHKELAGLLELIQEILVPGGRLLLSTNASDIHNYDLIDWAKNYPWKIIEQGGQSSDFPTKGKIKESSLAVVWFEKLH